MAIEVSQLHACTVQCQQCIITCEDQQFHQSMQLLRKLQHTLWMAACQMRYGAR